MSDDRAALVRFSSMWPRERGVEHALSAFERWAARDAARKAERAASRTARRNVFVLDLEKFFDRVNHDSLGRASPRECPISVCSNSSGRISTPG
jgi:hypothetical protein